MHNFKCLNAIHTESLTRKLLSKFRKVKKKKEKKIKKEKKWRKLTSLLLILNPQTVNIFSEVQYFLTSSRKPIFELLNTLEAACILTKKLTCWNWSNESLIFYCHKSLANIQCSFWLLLLSRTCFTSFVLGGFLSSSGVHFLLFRPSSRSPSQQMSLNLELKSKSSITLRYLREQCLSKYFQEIVDYLLSQR